MVLRESFSGLRDAIQDYVEGDGLIAPAPNPTHIFRTCDNGVMFFSEYHILLVKNGESTYGDCFAYANTIRSCFVADCPGLVARAPGDRGFEAPDDYYGVFAACVVLEHKTLGNQILEWGRSHFGSYNTNEPKKWTFDSWLFRQPQLAAAAYCAGSTTIPLHIRPLLWYTAAVIATSCMGVDPSNADARRLCWLLIQAVTPYSWLCRMASKLWFKRLYKTYGPEGMRAVAARYYSAGHPFITYFITE